MTRNQQVSSCYAHLEAFVVPRFFQLRSLPGGTPILQNWVRFYALIN